MTDFLEFMKREQVPVEAALVRTIDTLPCSVQEIARYSLLSGGKRLRPMLTLLCAKLFMGDKVAFSQRMYDASIVLEMFHVASLLHDDILDNADTRRGQASAHVRFGLRPCILAGDALLAAGNRLMAEIAKEYNCPELMESISNALLRTSSGEIEEIGLVGKIIFEVHDYLSVIEGKTAYILRSACEVGGLLARTYLAEQMLSQGVKKTVTDKDLDNLIGFGLNLGMAFQIVDDALDFEPEAVIGKPSGGDLRERKCTPPIAMYVKALEGAKQADFIQKFSLVAAPVFGHACAVPQEQGRGGANKELHVSENTGACCQYTEKTRSCPQVGTDFSDEEFNAIINEIVAMGLPEQTKALADCYLEVAEHCLSAYDSAYCSMLLQALHFVRNRKK